MASIAIEMSKMAIYKYLYNVSGFSDATRERLRNNSDGIIRRLKTIGKLKRGYQFDTRTCKMQPYGWWTTFERTVLRPDCRQNTINFIREAIEDGYVLLVFRLAETDGSDQLFCRNLLQDILDCKKGLDELVRHPNYEQDIGFCADIATLMNKIDDIYAKVKSKHPNVCHEACSLTSSPSRRQDESCDLQPRERSMSFGL